MEKSKIKTAPRVLTKGGMILTYGQHDTEHCTLDMLKNKGFIENDHFDAGYHLRGIYYSFTKTGRWIDGTGKGYDSSDHITPKDVAEAFYNKAIANVKIQNRAITRCVCLENTHIPADYHVLMQIREGLGDLINFFKKNPCEEI